MSYRVIALPSALVAEVRRTLRAPGYGHAAQRELARGTGPCRACLAPFAVGAEERLLFTYDAFRGLHPWPLPGPVFVHAEPCEAHTAPGFPPGLAGIPMIVEAYAADRILAHRAPLPASAPGDALRDALARPGVEYLHLRHAEAGCYIASVHSGPASC